MASNPLNKPRSDAHAIFNAGLQAVDARLATLRFIDAEKDCIRIGQTLLKTSKPIYSICLGKAALGMAQALSETVADHLVKGICVCPEQTNIGLNDRWRMFHGGHPLPNEESLSAARAAFQLLDQANSEHATVIFLISGGGSAMIESPIATDISLQDLETANGVLVSCGAKIAEINTIRQAFSAIKGGKLLARAPDIDAITLIISDTNEGDEASVASGPTVLPPLSNSPIRELISHYKLEARLPPSILRAVDIEPRLKAAADHPRYVIADNRMALEGAKAKAESLGFETVIASNISEQPISEGCAQLLAQLNQRHGRICLLSGGEFSCPVRGDGLGGRNSESVLRWALSLEPTRNTTVLSAGTDGIDGNSPAAGAIADSLTMQRARSLDIDAADFLERSDSFSFFDQLGDAIITGPTGTNVRDIRVLLGD